MLMPILLCPPSLICLHSDVVPSWCLAIFRTLCTGSPSVYGADRL